MKKSPHPNQRSSSAERIVATGQYAASNRNEEQAPHKDAPAHADDGWAEKTMPESSAERSKAAPETAGPAGTAATSKADMPRNDAGEKPPAPEEESRSDVAPMMLMPQTDLLGAPQIPIAGDAAACLAQIDGNSDSSIHLISAEAKTKRQRIGAFFARQRQVVSGFIGSNVQALTGFLYQKQASASTWLMSRAAAVQGFVLTLVSTAMAIGADIAGRIQGGIAALTASVVGGVTGVIEFVLNIARSIPISDIPGLGTVRRAVLNAANRIAGVIRRALANVQRFIDRVVRSVLTAIQRLIARVGTFILNVVMRLISIVVRAIAAINRQLTALRQRISDSIQRVGQRIDALLVRMEAAARARIDRAEAHARSEILANRQHGRETIVQILEFSYSQGDHPVEKVADDPLGIVENTSSKEQFESSARTALRLATLQVRLKNFEVLQRFRNETSYLIVMIIGAIADFMSDLRVRAMLAFQEIWGRVTQAIAQLIQQVTTIATQIVAGVRSMINRLGAALTSVVTVIVNVVRTAVNALTNVARTVINAVRSFLRSIITRLVSLFSSDAAQGGAGAGDASSLTSTFDQFDPARLAAAARMSSPPAAAAVVLVGVGAAIAAAAEAAAALIITILFWVAVVLLIIAAIILIVLLIRWIIARVRAMPKARPIPRAKPRVRRRRSSRKPLRWNPSMSYGVVVASGGMPGTLDTTARLPARAPLHGHHVWPKYVGGVPVQPLMSIRDTVHISFIHPSLHVVMKGTAIAMGQDITTSATSLKNIAFVAHIRSDIRDRTAFTAVMSAYYAGLNAVTHPAIPPPSLPARDYTFVPENITEPFEFQTLINRISVLTKSFSAQKTQKMIFNLLQKILGVLTVWSSGQIHQNKD